MSGLLGPSDHQTELSELSELSELGVLKVYFSKISGHNSSSIIKILLIVLNFV